MLLELRIRDLGVIEDASLVLTGGMTALTGETGAGKTMLVEAIELLVGGRAEPIVVRAGAAEATVEGRFLVPADGGPPGELREVVATRIVPAVGRSRAYVDGRLAPAAALAELGSGLVDIHGQHAHQSLLSVAVQRRSLDRFGGVDLDGLEAARARLAAVDAALAALGGDERARAREIDLLRYQVDELDRAALTGADEDATLDAEEDRLADATAHQEAAAAAVAALVDDGGALDAIGTALAAVSGRGPFATPEGRLRAVVAELSDAAGELRSTGESIDDDPARLDTIRARRQLLHDLRRKYGDTLAEVLEFADQSRLRLAELLDHDRRAAALDGERTEALVAVDAAARVVQAARIAAAPRLAEAVTSHLADLAMPRATLEVAVGGPPPGDEVTFLLAANPGAPAAPLAKIASGGELARTMLALRLVLMAGDAGAPSGPTTLVFDEVDAGIGGDAALAVGRALAALASDGRQVLVVTHLPQVAACASSQLVVTKSVDRTTTSATARLVGGDDRVAELSRMLAGTAGSAATRQAAADLLAAAPAGADER